MSLHKHTRSITELHHFVEKFATELRNAQQGEATSLGFIAHDLPKTSLVSPHEIFQVMCVGGSNLQVSKVMANQHLNLLSLAEESLPVLKTKRDLFEVMIQFVDTATNTIALNFAYPMEPKTKRNILDGKLLTGTKEHTLSDLVNTFVGEELSEYILEKTGKHIRVAVANDTVCLTLAGLEQARPDNLIAMILGTGNNTGMFLGADTVINLESGNFNQFEISDPGHFIDTHSTNPGKQLLEKEVAGAYVYKHFNYYAKLYGLETKLTSTKQVNELAQSGSPIEQHLAQHVIRESAKLVASLIAGFVQYKNSTIDLVVEGGFYRHGYRYKAFVQHYLEALELKPTAVHFIHVENSSILGGAHLVLPVNSSET